MCALAVILSASKDPSILHNDNNNNNKIMHDASIGTAKARGNFHISAFEMTVHAFQRFSFQRQKTQKSIFCV
jgi:hypothetical protein